MMLMFMKCSANVEAKHLGCYNGGRTGRTHLLKEARAWPTKINEHATSDTVCHVIQGRRREKGRPGSFEGPSIPLVFSSFSHL